MKFVWNYIHRHKTLMLKYGVVGATAAVVDFALLYILTDVVGWYYLWSATASFIVAALVNYQLNRTWTFKSSGQKRKQLPIFFIIATAGILINNGILYLGVEMGLHYLWAKVFATGFVTIWNFFGNKYLTFRVK